MNTYQKLAFGVVAVLVIAYAAAAAIESASVIVTLTAFAIALLTLRTTWKIIFGLIQLIGATIALIGHSVGKLGDLVADFAFARQQRLVKPNIQQVGRRVERPKKPESEDSIGFIESALQPSH